MNSLSLQHYLKHLHFVAHQQHHLSFQYCVFSVNEIKLNVHKYFSQSISCASQFEFQCLFAFQIFRSLESPAETHRLHKLHTNAITEREYLVGNLSMLTKMTDLRNLDRAISLELEKYELVC